MRPTHARRGWLAVPVLAQRGGLSRAFGGVLLAVYFVFMVLRIVVA